LNKAITFYVGKHRSTVLPTAIDPLLFLKTYQNLASARHVPMLSTDQQRILAESFTSLSVSEVPFSIEDFSSSVIMDSPTLESRGIFRATYPPINSADLFRLYLTADKSVYRNIPCPDVFLTPDKKHAYLHLGPVVASFLAGGVASLSAPTGRELDPSTSTEFTSYYTSPVARSVYADVAKIALLRGLEGKVFSIHIKDWADDAQKNSSRTNLLAYNIRTITFLCHGGNRDIRYFNYVLSVGVKGSDHEEVERILTSDLKDLSSLPHLFYSGYHQGTFWATVNLVAGVRDRPARGDTFFIGIHSHIFAKRHRYSLYITTNGPRYCHV
jgi:hypothetical protein